MSVLGQAELAHVPDVYVPEVYPAYCSRRVLVSEWVDGVKLTQLPPDEARRRPPIRPLIVSAPSQLSPIKGQS